MRSVCRCTGPWLAETEIDPEGRVASGIRQIVGDVPNVAAMDLHAVISQRLVDAADALVFLHTYPHTDMRDTGQRAARLLLRQLDGDVKPTTARVSIPHYWPAAMNSSPPTGRFGEAIRRCQEIEASLGGLAAGVIIGNPFTDVPDLQVQCNCHHRRRSSPRPRTGAGIGPLHVGKSPLLDSQTHLCSNKPCVWPKRTEGLTVFSDAADSTASGASGDSNAILKGLLQYNYSKRALIPIVDAPCGGSCLSDWSRGADSLGPWAAPSTRSRFAPVELPLYVKSLSDGAFTTEFGYVVPP